MKFNKDHLVDIESLTRPEAYMFLEFLSMERDRHLATALGCSTRAALWQSEHLRQLEEVKHIDGGIEEVKKRFGIELEEK